MLRGVRGMGDVKRKCRLRIPGHHDGGKHRQSTHKERRDERTSDDVRSQRPLELHRHDLRGAHNSKITVPGWRIQERAGHSGTTGWKWLCHCPTQPTDSLVTFVPSKM